MDRTSVDESPPACNYKDNGYTKYIKRSSTAQNLILPHTHASKPWARRRDNGAVAPSLSQPLQRLSSSIRLFFIRHGKSVDNAAGVYGGSRDAPLTAHGALQARRLASSLAQSAVLTHVLSSPLQRAARTADAVCEAQNEARGAHLAVVRAPGLRERGFGSAEGLSFRVGSAAEKRAALADVETAQSMRARVDRFLDEHLVPLLRGGAGTGMEMTCAVVAHGIILGVLVRALAERVPRGGVLLPRPPEGRGLALDASGLVLPRWSNMGYLEIAVSRPVPGFGPSAVAASRLPVRLHIIRANCTVHLEDLQKTRGGIGSAPFDARQRTMDHFAPETSGQNPRGSSKRACNW